MLRICIIKAEESQDLGKSLWEPLFGLADVSQVGPCSFSRWSRWGSEEAFWHDCEAYLSQAPIGAADYVIAECAEGFFWHAAARLTGRSVPFALVPHFNPIVGRDLLYFFLSSQVSSGADFVCAGSRCVARSVEGFGVRASTLFPLGIDLRRFQVAKEPRANTLKSLRLGEESAHVLYAGRLEPDKHIEELIVAVGNVEFSKSVKLIICFHHYDVAYMERCKDLARGLLDVHFVYSPTPVELVRYYQAADVFCTTALSVNETFGRAPLEAIACGTPTVTYAYNGFREHIPVNCGSLVSPISKDGRPNHNLEGIASALTSWLARPGEDMGERLGRSEQVRCYSHEAGNRELVSLMTKAPEPSKVGSRALVCGLEGYTAAARAHFGSWSGESLHAKLFSVFQGNPNARPGTKRTYSAFIQEWFQGFW